MKWYRLSAAQGNALAQYNLGLLYFNGKGVAQNHQEALRLYQLAAEQGLVSAQYVIGWMYANGQGVQKDLIRAQMRFNLATDKGNNDAQKWRTLVAKEMTSIQINQAQKMAEDCEKRSYKNCD